jgi:hypothetical protein
LLGGRFRPVAEALALAVRRLAGERLPNASVGSGGYCSSIIPAVETAIRHPLCVDDPRPLTERENDILDFLLSADFPGVEKLRKQAETILVTGRCDCGCATVYLTVDESLPTADEVEKYAAVDAAGRPGADDAPPPELILFVRDGRLSSVEIVWYDSPIPKFPSAEDFETPVAAWSDANGT